MKTHFSWLVVVLLMVLFDSRAFGESPNKPNFILIFADDQGYGDLGCFGSTTIKTPNIDRLAEEGRKFTNFMVASPVCTPSRAALLTGCYPKRIGMHKHVLFPESKQGINPDEFTIADLCKSQGYATACFGKWHLGHHPQTLPQQLGFDTYFGIPYSNDMNHPDNKGRPKIGSDELWKDQESTLTLWNTPLMENEQIVELPVDQRTVTRRYTDRSIDFIKRNRDRPFFIYLPHSMPHIPLYVPEDVYDSNPQNAYINVIEHMDSEVGRIITTIDELGLNDTTYIIYTSDNGPWLKFKNHGGTAKPLRGGKGTTFEGGLRVPCVMKGPSIPVGSVCDDLISTIDLLPTLASMLSHQLSADKVIDGKDVSNAIKGAGGSSRDEFAYYSSRGSLDGIRVGKWKLLVNGVNQKPKQSQKSKRPQVMLFDLEADLGEQKNLANDHPEVVLRLRNRMTEIDDEITKNGRKAWQKYE